MTIKETLDNLPKAERLQLEYALQNSLLQYIRIAGTNKFIGVHVIGVPHLDVENRVGSWSIGTIKGVKA